MGRLVPLTIHTNPNTPAWSVPCRSRARIRKRVQCETVRSQAENLWPAPLKRGNAHRINYGKILPQYLVFVNHIQPYFAFRKILKNISSPAKKWEPLAICYLEGYTLHLDKRREPIPCPGSHTGAADSVHHAHPQQNQRIARPENTRSKSRAQEVGRGAGFSILIF